MARRHSRASNVSVSPWDDDFTLIKGIGPKIKTRLHSAGILTFAQLGALSAEEISSVATDLSTKRIARENWIGQARQLARKWGKRARAQPHIGGDHPTGRQHYATFIVELLLDEINDVRRIRCVHIQSDDQDTWAGWTEARLVGFVVEHAGLRLPGCSALVSPSQPQAALTTTATVLPIPPPTPEASPAFAQTPRMETRSGEPEAASTRLVQETREELGGGLRLLDLATMATDSDQPCRVLPAGKPFRVRLSLDLTGVARPSDVPLDCITSIYAKRFGGGSCLILGEARDAIKPSDQVTVQVLGLTLPPGLYRLDAIVRLNASLSDQAPRGLMAMLRSGLLQVY